LKYQLYGGEVELEFDEKKHVYRVEGAIVPSVTGITGIIDKSGPLMWWGIGQALAYVEEQLHKGVLDLTDEVERKKFFHDAHRAHFRASKEATDIGTMAHEWIEKYLAGENPSAPKNKKLRATVESWREWAAPLNLIPIETEFKCYSKENGYAGTCDFDGWVGDERCIVDWKTGKAVYPEHKLQTAAYLAAREEELFNVEYAARWVVVLPKDGGDIVAERLDNDTLERDLDGFLGALALHRAIKG